MRFYTFSPHRYRSNILQLEMKHKNTRENITVENYNTNENTLKNIVRAQNTYLMNNDFLYLKTFFPTFLPLINSRFMTQLKKVLFYCSPSRIKLLAFSFSLIVVNFIFFFLLLQFFIWLYDCMMKKTINSFISSNLHCSFYSSWFSLHLLLIYYIYFNVFCWWLMANKYCVHTKKKYMKIFEIFFCQVKKRKKRRRGNFFCVVPMNEKVVGRMICVLFFCFPLIPSHHLYTRKKTRKFSRSININ